MASGRGAAGGALSGAAAGTAIMPGIGTAIGAGLGGLLGLFGGGGQSEKDMSPELQRMYALELQRFNANSPLIEAAYRLAFNRLPTAARGDAQMPSYADANAAVPYVTPGGDYAEAEPVRQALRAMEVRQRMAQPIYEAIARLAQSRMPRAYQPTPTNPTMYGPRSGERNDENNGLPQV